MAGLSPEGLQLLEEGNSCCTRHGRAQVCGSVREEVTPPLTFTQHTCACHNQVLIKKKIFTHSHNIYSGLIYYYAALSHALKEVNKDLRLQLRVVNKTVATGSSYR